MAVAAKRGDMASARTLAKEIVHTKKVRGDGGAVVVLYAQRKHRDLASVRSSTPVARSQCTAKACRLCCKPVDILFGDYVNVGLSNSC